MHDFVIHTLNSAPKGAREPLERLRQNLGFVPNVAATMAASPQLVDAFVRMRGLFAETRFTPAEQEMILLAAATENRCSYCVAAHSTAAVRLGAPPEAVKAVREGRAPEGRQRAAIVALTRTIIRGRGTVTDAMLGDAEREGFEPSDLLSICLGIMVGTLVSFVFHLVPETPLDDVFMEQAWSR